MSAANVMRATRSVAVVVVLASWFVPVDAEATWPRFPDVNLPLGTGAGLQVHPSILEDGAGGAFMAWHDSRSGNYNIHVQHVGATGVPSWTANGVVACSATGDQIMTQMAPDGAGGVIVAWYDYRAGNGDIYVQRLNANGVPQWTANGVALCTAAGDQTEPYLVSDGQGGAIVAWADGRTGTQVDVYARRVNATGTPQWAANGVVVCATTGTRAGVRLVTDGAGGAIITWEDTRTGAYDIYTQRVTGSGVAQWVANGVLASAAANDHRQPTIVSDGTGGAFIAWMVQTPSSNLTRMQRVSALGVLQWSADGVLVVTGGGVQEYVQIAADGTGGVIGTWLDLRGSFVKVVAQRLSSAGVLLWPSNGVTVGSTDVNHEDPRIVADGAGGAVITWRMPTNGGEIWTQRLTSTGAVAWASEGVPLTDALGDRAWPRIASDAVGGAIVVWHDTRNGDHDVYAQRVDRYGYLGNVEPVVTSVRDVLNDQGGKVKVSWNASDLDADPTFGIFDYRLWRSVSPAAISGSDPRAARAMTRDPDVAASGEALLLTSSAGATYAWELAFFQPAAGLPSYSLTTATSNDSIAGSNPRTLFMVEARSGFSLGDPHWFSAPDSGYSVDNLAPATPSALTGNFANGITYLSWAANSEADLSNYRLYRGTSPGFTPSAGNRIASPTGTSLNDPAGAPAYYKLSAVDIHGNESGFALLTPAGTLDAPVGGSPVALRLGVPGPNPAASRARIAFDVPRPQQLSLVIYDATGRAVRVLFRGSHLAGSFSSSWDLRDDAGRAVANGVYFVRLECAGHALTQRMIAMR